MRYDCEEDDASEWKALAVYGVLLVVLPLLVTLACRALVTSPHPVLVALREVLSWGAP